MEFPIYTGKLSPPILTTYVETEGSNDFLYICWENVRYVSYEPDSEGWKLEIGFKDKDIIYLSDPSPDVLKSVKETLQILMKGPNYADTVP